jgi:hypothetical protein
MLGLIKKLAPLITGLVKNEDGTDKPVPGEFNWLVRLPLLIGALLLVAGLFAPVSEDRRAEVYEVGMALLVGGPVAYDIRRRMTKADALKAPASPPVAAPPPPVEAPKTDVDAANAIEKL